MVPMQDDRGARVAVEQDFSVVEERLERYEPAEERDELPLPAQAARRNGVSPEEIAEVLLQCAVYCGVPAANSAFHVFQRVIEEDRD